MKVTSRFLMVCVGVMVLVPGLLSAPQTGAGLAGTWSGRATKQGGKSYRVTVILDGSGDGFIEYPTMKCGGTLHYLRKEGDAFSYGETIMHGKTGCEDGRVDVLPSGNVLMWTWSAGQRKATGTLTKTQANAASRCGVQCDVNYDRDLQACYQITNSGEQQKCQDRAQEDVQACNVTCKN